MGPEDRHTCRIVPERPGRALCLLFLCLFLGPLTAGATAAEIRPDGRVEALEGVFQVERHVGKSASGVRKLYGGRSAPLGKAPEPAARSFLKAVSGLLGLSPDLGDLEVKRVLDDGLFTHVWFEQLIGGHPVVDSLVAVHLDAEGRVVMVDNFYRPGLQASPGKASLDEAQAAAAAYAFHGSPDELRMPIATRPVMAAVGGRAVPAYEVDLAVKRPFGSWRTLVDATDGGILRVQDLLYRVDGQIYDPNPMVFLQNFTLDGTSEAASAVPATALVRKELKGLDGSNFLRGSFADVTSTKAGGRTSSAGDFIFTRDTKDFAQVMCYYHLDTAQRDLIQGIAGVTNVRNDPISADAHNFDGVNAFYDSLSRGLFFGDAAVDAAEDADVILHEYGHAALDAQVPGALEGAGGAYHEGFADFQANTYSATRTLLGGISDPDPACMGEWFTSQLLSLGKCLRRSDGSKKFPDDLDGEVHDDGEIIQAALWDIRNGISGNTGLGNSAAYRLVLRANFLLTPSLTFNDVGLALLQTDSSLNSGANQKLIVQSFVHRGIFQPVVTSVSPSFIQLTTATTLTLIGANFLGNESVSFSDGKTIATSGGDILSNTRMRIVLPPDSLTPGTLSVRVTNSTTDLKTGSSVQGGFLVDALIVDDHPNKASDTTTTSSRDLLTVNSRSMPGNIEVETIPGTSEREADVFRLNLLKDHTYTIETQLGTLSDTRLSLIDQDQSTVLKVNDDIDATNGFTASRIVFTPTTNAVFFVKVDAPRGLGTYGVTVIDPQTADDHPNEAEGTRIPIDNLDTVGTAASGEINYAGDVDFFRFEGKEGAVYDIETSLSTLRDSVLAVGELQDDSSGNPVFAVLDSNDDRGDVFGDLSSKITGFQTTEKKTYFVRVTHSNLASSSAVGTYSVSVTQRQASLHIRSVDVTQTLASQGSTLPLSVSVLNSGSVGTNNLAVTPKFLQGSKDVGSSFTATLTTGPGALAAGESGIYRFDVALSSKAPRGSITIDASMAGLDVTDGSGVSDDSSVKKAAWTVQSPPRLRIQEVLAAPGKVSRGQVVPVTFTVSNSGEASLTVTSVGLTIRQGAGASSTDLTTQFGITPDSGNSTAIAGSSSEKFRFTARVGAAASLGNVTVDAFARGVDDNSGLPAASNAAVSADVWTVQTPASLTLLSLATVSSRVSIGQGDAAMDLTVSNSGQATARLDSTSFDFTGSGGTDRSLDFSVTPSASNPQSLRGGETATLRYSTEVSSRATTGPITIKARVFGTDGNSGSPLATGPSTISTSWILELPPGVRISNLTASRLQISQGQSFVVTLTAVNDGQAGLTGTTATLSFRNSAGSSRDEDFTVSPRSGNPSTLAGRASSTFVFDVVSSSSATTGAVSILGSYSGRDVNAGTTFSAPASPALSLAVQRPGELEVRSVTASPAVLARDGLLAVTVELANTGEAALNLAPTLLLFRNAGGGSVTPDYTVTPGSGAPAVLFGGQQATLSFTARASSTATTGMISVEASAAATDDNTASLVSASTDASRRASFRVGALNLRITSPREGDLLFADEPLSFSGTAVEDTGAVLAPELITWTSNISGTIGTGTAFTTTLPPETHALAMSGTSASGLTSVDRVTVQVLPPLEAQFFITIEGRTGLNRQTVGVPPGFTVIYRNPARQVSVQSLTSGVDGFYSMLLARADAAAVAPGDTLAVEVRDKEGLPRPVTPSSIVVRSRDLLNKVLRQDLLVRDLDTVTLGLVAGLNLVGVPLSPATTNAVAYNAADLLRDTGSTFVGRYVRDVPSGRSRLETYFPGFGMSAFSIAGNEGYLLDLPASRQTTLKGTPWPDSVLVKTLGRGPNLLAIPRGAPTTFTASDLLTLTGSRAVTRTITGPAGRGVFDTFTSSLGKADFTIDSGRGYLTVTTSPATVTLPANK